MEAHVQRIFPRVPSHSRLRLVREPHVEDFAGLGDAARKAEVVVGVGGGRALDAAKVVAHWGRAFHTASELGALLAAGGRVTADARARMVMAPSIASSGSESSRGAIITVGAQKMGLRGPSVEPDDVVHDPTLWTSLPTASRAHFAFDVFAHFAETTASKRCAVETLAHAREGMGEFWSWWRDGGRELVSYGAAMRAAFHAGRCLATSSTCLPHRVQYVLGPATDTTHVEGIWALFPGWFDLLIETSPSAAGKVAKMLNPTMRPDATEFARVTLPSVHGLAAPSRRIEIAQEDVFSLSAQVTGDLAADPAFVGPSSVERLLRSLSHD
ncbi:MAG: iron-containing alcohol dehydrogenase [Candidatus Didemnitutus sp.]|nr:iron-containing alcohol dehydrogenase [Candidatus Didemnitutus sp.]